MTKWMIINMMKVKAKILIANLLRNKPISQAVNMKYFPPTTILLPMSPNDSQWSKCNLPRKKKNTFLRQR